MEGGQKWKPHSSGKLHTKDLACVGSHLVCGGRGVVSLLSWPHPALPAEKCFSCLARNLAQRSRRGSPCLGPVALGFYALVCLWVLRAEVAPE